MKILIIAAIVLITGLIQATILSTVAIFNVKPDILLILAIFFALRRPFREALIVAAACGFLKDVFSTAAFGINTFSFILCVVFIKKIKQYLFEDDSLVRTSLVFIISLINSVIFLFVGVFISDLTFSAVSLVIILLESIYTTLISPFAFNIYRKCALKFSI